MTRRVLYAFFMACSLFFVLDFAYWLLRDSEVNIVFSAILASLFLFCAILTKGMTSGKLERETRND